MEIQIIKKEVKLSLFTDDMNHCAENSIASIRKLLDIIQESSKTADNKIHIQSQLYFCVLAMKNQKLKF